ncbi:GNAT family N-acetyltransferase [Mesobacillus foraminis]|uniref:GNAT family N-acetyltransferase n=1 Tax=Mesobacillus foraminis TaxID=279826 RepID=UPI001BE88BF6|nr:GNAT family N-acetyltransferase [Mesobacillus foraminis]MBT2755305.1 GNAT family N-acetyltransferase [Mesobacillus foraminis]
MEQNGKNILIRLLEIHDAEMALALELRNREFFQTFAALRKEDFYTLEGQRERIRTARKRKELDEYYLFGIFLHDSKELIGTLMLSEILRGALQSCYIGYFLDKEHNGKGYMTEGVQLAVNFAFNQMKLHRIEAGVMPHNLGSISVLEKSGFLKEGIARKNVKINGKWEDHQILAIINETL